MAFEWSEDLAVGVAEIDGQHQELIRRINGLLEAITSGRGIEEVPATLHFMGVYAGEHFAAEERLMAGTAYPRSAEHHREHAEFVAMFESYRQRLAAEGATAELVVFLHRNMCAWLVDHICRTDKAMALHVRQSMAAAG